MSIPFYIPPNKAQILEVIFVSATRGSGTPEDPERLINLFFAKDGELLACYGPINGEPDSYLPLSKA
jgi:hypothetical protein